MDKEEEMKICEVFSSIQGEGKYSGHPVLFIRTSGCTRACNFCDTKYHINGKNMTPKQIVKRIEESGLEIVVWTGGEPMLWEDEIYEIIQNTWEHKHHLETNGDILPKDPSHFEYIAFSPKEKKVQKNVVTYVNQVCYNHDIKIVTDLKMNKDMLDDATILMPLSTYDEKKDNQIQQDVWEYCVENKLKYAHRVHVSVWGKSIGK